MQKFFHGSFRLVCDEDKFYLVFGEEHGFFKLEIDLETAQELCMPTEFVPAERLPGSLHQTSLRVSLREVFMQHYAEANRDCGDRGWLRALDMLMGHQT